MSSFFSVSAFWLLAALIVVSCVVPVEAAVPVTIGGIPVEASAGVLPGGWFKIILDLLLVLLMLPIVC